MRGRAMNRRARAAIIARPSRAGRRRSEGSHRIEHRQGRGKEAAAGVSSEARTIVFFPEGAFGPTNNCVGIGEVLRRRGHRVVFIIEESFAGTLEAKGFEERLMRLGPPP